MNWLKILVITGIGVVVVVGIAFALVPKPVASEYEEVTRGDVQVTIDEEGMTRVKDRYTVAAPLVGEMARVELKVGDSVKAGDAITVLSPSEPALQNLRQQKEVKAGIAMAEASFSQAEAAEKSAVSALELARKELNRARKLHKGKHISQEQVDVAETRFEAAQATLGSAKFARRAAGHQVEQSKAALITTNTGASLREIEIRSPVEGRVLNVFRDYEGPVMSGEMLVEIGNPESLEVVVDLLSRDAVQVEPGMEVMIERWGGDEKLEGRVRVVEPSGFTKVSALGVEEQRVNVIIDFTSAPAKWRAIGDQYRVEAGIVTVTRSDVVKISNSAVFNTADGPAVFLVQDSKARLKQVSIGKRTGRESEVVSGLQDGDTVVIHPGDDIEDGTALKKR